MGSFVSRVDPRHSHNDDDIALTRGEKVASANRGVTVAAEAGLLRGGSSSSSSTSFDSRKKSGEAKSRVTNESRENKRNDNLSSKSAVPLKEKRKALSLIKSKSKSGNRGGRGRTSQRDSSSASRNRPRSMKTNENHSVSSKSAISGGAKTKNGAQTLNATQSRQTNGNENNVRIPLDPISENKNQATSSTTVVGKKKKLRPTAASYNLRRNGSKSSSALSKDKPKIAATAVTAAAAADTGIKSDENGASKPTMKVPVDPPGAILGALPWMNHSHGQHQHVSSADNGGHFYGGGGGGHPVYAPANNNWGYQPSHQQVSNNVDQRSQQWTVPHFLAPFANFMASNPNIGYHNGNIVQMVHNTSNVQPNSHVETGGAMPPPPSSEAEDFMSDDESMASSEEGVDETPIRSADMKEVDTKLIPSTFAPPEYIKRIRARNAAAIAANNVVQTRSMTAKKNRAERRDGTLRSYSASKGYNSLDQSKTNVTAAHQACSPRSDVSRGGKESDSVKVPDVEIMSDNVDSPTPQVMTVLGKRVTMIDPERKVFVIDLISPEKCDKIRRMADNHTREIIKSGSNAETWRTLYTYTKMDLPVVEVKDMVKKYTENIMTETKQIVGEIFGMKKEAMKLRPRSWKEPHLLLYQQLEGREPHTGIEMHYDGCDITWQAMLTDIDEYEGGGTYFRCLRKTIKLRQGQVLVHPGELYHKGIDITYGVRCLLVCFTDGMNPKILDDSKSDEHKEEYEKNTYIY